MLDALLRLWAGVLAAAAPVKLLLLGAFLSLALVGLCLLAWCCCFGWSCWRRYTRGG